MLRDSVLRISRAASCAPAVRERIRVHLKKIRKDVPAVRFPSHLFSSSRPLLSAPFPSVPLRRGGRSVRRNAALSSKAHRHSSPRSYSELKEGFPFSSASCPSSLLPLRAPLSFFPATLSARPCRSIRRRNGRRGKIRWRSLRDAKRRSTSPRLSDTTSINNSAARHKSSAFFHLLSLPPSLSRHHSFIFFLEARDSEHLRSSD